MGFFEFSCVDFLFTCVGLLCLLADIGLDIFAAVSFYQDKAYASLGLLLLFLVGSSLLVQAYSWLFYSYDNFQDNSEVESCLSPGQAKKYKDNSEVEKRLSPGQLKLLHVFQLGIYVRHASVIELSCRSVFPENKAYEDNAENKTDKDNTENDALKDKAVYLSHDLSLLRLFETFSEGAPQFVLMLTLILQQGQLDYVTVLKAIGSASAIASSVTMYHRSLRSFVPDKEKLSFASSLVYFLWNLLLLSSRLTALALFASVLPCFIFTHFFCSWLVLLFFAWRSRTELMDSPCGEWLYRATVGLIWYFDWFNVVEGRTRNRTLLYHGYILADISALCGLWYWKMTTESHHFKIPDLYALITAVSVVGFYAVGLLFKIMYYKCSHPNLNKELKGGSSGDEVDYPASGFRGMNADKVSGRYNKRMRMLAQNFYS